jgi:hypothetical protein
VLKLLSFGLLFVPFSQPGFFVVSNKGSRAVFPFLSLICPPVPPASIALDLYAHCTYWNSWLCAQLSTLGFSFVPDPASNPFNSPPFSCENNASTCCNCVSEDIFSLHKGYFLFPHTMHVIECLFCLRGNIPSHYEAHFVPRPSPHREINGIECRSNRSAETQNWRKVCCVPHILEWNRNSCHYFK